MELSAAARWVEKRVRLAFDGVTLGFGMGLREADAHDDRATPETRAAARRADEKQSWHPDPGSEAAQPAGTAVVR